MADVTKISATLAAELPYSAILTTTVTSSYFGGKLNNRVSIDSGSQGSFISLDVVEQLKLPVIAQVPLQITTFGPKVISEHITISWS